MGLDIGSRSIKAVVLEQANGGFRVAQLSRERIAGDAFNERDISDFEAVANALKKVKLTLKLKKTQVAIAVSGASVLTKVIYMEPDQTDFELESQIEIEADSLIPYPLDEMYLDFETLGESSTQPGKIDVLLSAAHRQLVDNRLTLLMEQQLEPKIVDIETYAFGNSLINLLGDECPGHCAAVNIGASQLQLAIIKEGRVDYVSEHQFGAEQLLQDVMASAEMTREQAIVELANADPDVPWRAMGYANFLMSLQQHLQRALQIYTSAANQPIPEVLMLSGGGAMVAGLIDDLDADMAQQVRLFNPFDSVDCDEQQRQAGPQFAIAMGLAMRRFDQ